MSTESTWRRRPSRVGATGQVEGFENLHDLPVMPGHWSSGGARVRTGTSRTKPFGGDGGGWCEPLVSAGMEISRSRDDELTILVAEATADNWFVMAHAHGTDGIKAVVRSGSRSIEHGAYLDEEAIEMMLERGTWLVPTLSAPRAIRGALARGTRNPDSVVRKADKVIEGHKDSFTRASCRSDGPRQRPQGSRRSAHKSMGSLEGRRPSRLIITSSPMRCQVRPQQESQVP